MTSLKNFFKNKVNILYSVIMALSIAVMILTGFQKEGYHVDELYSYGLANSEYLPFMHFGVSGYDVKDWMKDYGPGESLVDLFKNLAKDFSILKAHGFRFKETQIYQDYLIAQINSNDTYTTTWVDGQEYRDYLSVSPTNRFNLASVYYNQRGDVHPPLYYFLMNVFCSFFVGSFSKWYGIVVNMLIGVVCLDRIYRLVKKHFGGDIPALCMMAVYGLSCGFMTTVIYIRMYMLLTLFTLWFLDKHLDISAADYSLDKKSCRRLALITILGYLTHYYFIVYAIGVAAVFAVTMLIKRRYVETFKYVLTLAISAVIGLCVWPFSVKHVFSGYRGTESIGKLTSGAYSLQRISIMWKQLVWENFGKAGWVFLILALLCIVAIPILAGVKNAQWGKAALISLPQIFYLAVVAQIVPFYAERYIMPLFPIVLIWVVYSAFRAEALVEEKLAVKLKLPAAGLIVALLLIAFNNAFVTTPNYLFKGGTDVYEVKENTDCIYVLSDYDWNESTDETNILAKCNRVGVVYESNLAVLADEKIYSSTDNILVIVRDKLDVGSVVEKVNDTLFEGSLYEVSRDRGANSTRIWMKVK